MENKKLIIYLGSEFPGEKLLIDYPPHLTLGQLFFIIFRYIHKFSPRLFYQALLLLRTNKEKIVYTLVKSVVFHYCRWPYVKLTEKMIQFLRK